MLPQDKNFILGTALAITSTLFIGSSFVIKKIGLLRLNHKGSLRAGSGGYGYLKEWIWWLGLITMGVGETANFAAYAFAPASLVTPLGALSVLVSAVLASKCLNEHLNLLGKLGCVLCILGSSVIVIHSNHEDNITTLAEFITKISSSNYDVYGFLVISISLFICVHSGPRYGHKNVVVYIVLCSCIGSLTVILCKGLGLALKSFLAGDEINSLLVSSFLLGAIICIVVQMVYLNKALDLFSTSIVTPVYYVFFTSFVIIASNILLDEWRSMRAEDVFGSICGFLIVIIAIFMLNAFKDLDICLNDVSVMCRPKHDLLRNDRYEKYQSTIVRDV